MFKNKKERIEKWKILYPEESFLQKGSAPHKKDELHSFERALEECRR